MKLKNSPYYYLKYLIIFCILSFLFNSELFSQNNDPKISIAGKSEGIILKTELLASGKLIPSSKDIMIVSFSISYPIGEDDLVELFSTSDTLTREMKDHILKLKPGTDLTIENIKAKRDEKTLILEAITLKVME